MTTSDLGLVLLTGAVVVLAAIVAVRLAHGIGLPGLLVFLGLGLALSCFRRGRETVDSCFRRGFPDLEVMGA